jgi:hypothetical protein
LCLSPGETFSRGPDSRKHLEGSVESLSDIESITEFAGEIL